MKSRGYLRNFSESVDKVNEELYIPNQVHLPAILASEEKIPNGPEQKIIYSSDWKYPKRVRGIPGTALQRYRPWDSLRRAGKERTFNKLQIIPEELPSYKITNPETYSMPQFPLYFFDGVPSFEEVPFGLGNLQGQDFGQGPDYGDWGNLISSLSKAGVQYLGMEEAKYQAQIKGASILPTKPLIPGTSSNFLIYALVGGGLLYLLLKGKKSGKERFKS